MKLILRRLSVKPIAAFLIIFSPISLSAQNIISGTVTDTASKGLEGVTVALKGKRSNATVSDQTGNFKLTLPEASGVLIFSSVGYQTRQATAHAGTPINISLSSSPNQLSDVVVIGYGTRQKKDVTGAISTVSAADIEKSTNLNPEQALQGKASGVFIQSGGGDPGTRPTVRIRGINTFGYADPLYVVDGVPIYEGYAGATSGAAGDIRSPINILSMISPSDIESMTVLKDASAAAIYGVRASNGVILITTRKGKAGKPRIDVNSYVGTQNITRRLNTLNTQQYFSLLKESYANNPDANTTFGAKFGPLYDEGSPGYQGNSSTYDWYDALLNKNAVLQDHSVKVSGGTDAVSYYFSAGYTKQASPLDAKNLDRYSLAMNVESKFSKVVQAGITIRLADQHVFDNTQMDVNAAYSTIPFQPYIDQNGFIETAAATFKTNPQFDPSSANPGPTQNFDVGPTNLWGPQTRFNVFAFQQLNNNSFQLLRALGDAYVQIEPLKGLKLKGTLGGDYYMNLRKSFSSIAAWEYSQTPGNPYANQDGNAKGRYGERQTRTYNLNKELTLTYNHTFAKDHNIDIVLSASNQYSQFGWTDASGNVNYTDPQYWQIQNIPIYSSASAGILSEDALLGYLGRLSYKFKDKYYFDATYRYDGSSRLAPGHRWDGFPSFAAAWRISEEKFFPTNSFINDLKIRGGWGKLGNFLSTEPYKYLSNVSFTSDYGVGSGGGDPYGTQQQGAALPDFANVGLTWEKLKTTSVGFDAVLLNNQVNFSAEYYQKTTYDIIQNVSLPPNTGIQNLAALNIGTVRNSGIELQLGYNHKFGDVDFNVSGNITTVSNSVKTLNLHQPVYGTDPNQRVEEGYSMFYLYGYKVGGIFQTQAEIDAWRASHADATFGQDLANPTAGYQYHPGDMYFQDVHGKPTKPGQLYAPEPDSIIDGNDRTFLGKTIPGYYYGLSVGANWRGFDASLFFQGVGDVQKYDYLRASLEGMSGPANSDVAVLNRWTPDHPSTTVPRAVYSDPMGANRFSSRWVENAGYVRLKNLTLGYSIPAVVMARTGFIQRLRVYVSGLNLFTVTKYKGLDPESSGGGPDPLVEVIPTTRQLLVGINVTF